MEIIEIESEQDLFALLIAQWPSGEVDQQEFLNVMGITNNYDITLLKSHLGVGHTTPWSIADISQFMWESSNYDIE